MSYNCTCKFVAIGQPMDNEGCSWHPQSSYRCEQTACDNYRPRSQPDAVKYVWPRCVCGAIAQDHN